MIQTVIAVAEDRLSHSRIALVASTFSPFRGVIDGLETAGADVSRVDLAELQSLPTGWFDVVLLYVGQGDTLPIPIAHVAEQERLIRLVDEVSIDEPRFCRDFVLAPFRPAEVASRVYRAMREPRPIRRLVVGDVELDAVARTVIVAGLEVPFTSSEFQLLRALMAADGRVLTRAELAQTIGGDDDDDRSYNLRIHRLRGKLALSERVRIETVRTIGYRLAVQNALVAARTERGRGRH
jgi:DNA-binding winged helix-turn-helix (wHTH) protein